MMPRTIADRLFALARCGAVVVLLAGCTTPLFRGQDPEKGEITDLVAAEELDGPRFVGDLTVPFGLNHIKVEGVALVTRLGGTGSDPPPSPMRDQLKKDMQTHSVRNPEEVIASKDTAMVVVSGFIPPGASKGEIFDIAIQSPPRSETVSVRGGWLMQTRLREFAVLENTVHSGHIAGLAQGPILCDALFDKSDDRVLENRGRVIGGGVVQIARPLGLVIRDEHTSVKTSAMIGNAINDRFYDFDRGTKRGVANPTRDDYIEIKLHSRYKDNVTRFFYVLHLIAVAESPVERLARMTDLEKQLLEPVTSQRAALQLEAIGKEAAAILRKGLASTDPEVQFYSAESLAYLDEDVAIPGLLAAARDERAFRWRALLALSVIDQFAAQDALLELVNATSAETRYGAFRALRTRNARDPAVRGESLNDEFALHVLSSSGEPMIHISRTRRPEIVIFGQGQKLEAPSFLFAGKHILVKRNNEQTVKISRFMADGEDKHEICSNDLSDVIRTIAKLGGGYSEVMQALDEAKSKGFLAARLEVDALPQPGRIYYREESAGPGENSLPAPDAIPELFLDRLRPETSTDDSDDEAPAASGLTDRPSRPWYDRMTSWMVE